MLPELQFSPKVFNTRHLRRFVLLVFFTVVKFFLLRNYEIDLSTATENMLPSELMAYFCDWNTAVQSDNRLGASLE